MSITLRILVIGVLLFALTLPGQQPPNPVIRTGTQELLLDVIVRDKKGRPVRDLNAGEIHVFEEGAPQKISPFRRVEAGEAVRTTKDLDPLREIHLVTLVFERLGNEARQLSRQAALDFLKVEPGQNVYFAIFNIDQRLHALQQFTNDRDKLRAAVNRATTGQYSQFASQSDAIERELETMTSSQADLAASANAGRNGPGNPGSAAVAAKMAEVTLNMLRFSESLSRTQQGRSSIFSLLSLVKEQRGLPGRKTLLYFSEGLQVPTNLEEFFKSAISEANRANVSVYSIDARGLLTAAQNEATRDTLADAAGSSRRLQQSSGGEAITPDQVKALETAQDSIRANVQGALADLAESTGGFLIANSNDLRIPLRRITEDMRTYYELAYVPQSEEYNGAFRKISVRVDRPDVRVQTRSGYFALPPTAAPGLLPYEVALLSALDAKPLPRSFEYRAGALRFGSQNGRVLYGLVIEVPMQGIAFTEARTHLSVLALFKDSQGRVVEKFSQDVPLQAPADKVEAFRKGNFIQTWHTSLAPGRYTLETAVIDRGNQSASARRAVVMVAPLPKNITLSSLSLIRRIDPQSSDDTENPFSFQGGKVTPTLDGSVQGGPGNTLSLYFVLFPEKTTPDKPQLTMEFYRDGQLVARGAPALPAPDESGRIPYIANTHLDSFQPGQYEVRVVVKQGSSAVEERTTFSVHL